MSRYLWYVNVIKMQFKSIIEFQKVFNTEIKCRKHMEKQRWDGKPLCPYCGCEKIYRYNDGIRFNCSNKECKRVFSVTVGTVYENTKLPLVKWFTAIYILSVHSKGMSSVQLGIFLGVTQKTAWHLAHRVRAMLSKRSAVLLEGIIEADETFIGGKESNKNQCAYAKRKKVDTKRENDKLGIKTKATGGRGSDKKTPVLGAVSRDGEVITRVVNDTTSKTISKFIKDSVEKGATLITDEWQSYTKVGKEYNHETIQHKIGEYVRGYFHTNTIEGFWNMLKKQISGIHHSVSPKHLHRYCNEVAFRYNERKITQDYRVGLAMAMCNGGLKYKDLIAT